MHFWGQRIKSVYQEQNKYADSGIGVWGWWLTSVFTHNYWCVDRCMETMTTLMNMLTEMEDLVVGEKILEENESLEVCQLLFAPHLHISVQSLYLARHSVQFSAFKLVLLWLGLTLILLGTHFCFVHSVLWICDKCHEWGNGNDQTGGQSSQYESLVSPHDLKCWGAWDITSEYV